MQIKLVRQVSMGFFSALFLGLLLSVAPYSRSLCAIDNITFMIIVVAIIVMSEVCAVGALWAS